MIKTVIFDVDGTLTDTERLGMAAWTQAAGDLGLELPMETLKNFIGRNLADVLGLLSDLYGNDEDGPRLWQRHREIRSVMEETDLVLKTGAAECIDELIAAGYYVSVATSARRVTAEANLAHVGLLDKFACLTCGDEVEHGKPDPEIYLLACERAGVAPAECVVVEDSRNGCLAGIAAGAHVVAVPDIVALPDEVVDGCDAVLGTLLELPAAVAKLA